MSFNSISKLLEALEKPPGWEQQRQYRRLVQLWQGIVGEKIVPHTRPLYISRQVLWVATSSSVIAQELSLKRYSLLKKLNDRLSDPLVDVRFSPARWHDRNTRKADGLNLCASNEREHPSQWAIDEELSSSKHLPEGNDPKTAFARWAKFIQDRSHSLSVCPVCQSPTPKGELQRWDMCAYCVSNQWAQSAPRSVSLRDRDKT